MGQRSIFRILALRKIVDSFLRRDHGTSSTSMDGPFSAAEDTAGRAPSVNATNDWMDRRPDGGIVAAAGTATGYRVGAGRGDLHRHWFLQKPPAPPRIGLGVVGQTRVEGHGGAFSRSSPTGHPSTPVGETRGPAFARGPSPRRTRVDRRRRPLEAPARGTVGAEAMHPGSEPPIPRHFIFLKFGWISTWDQFVLQQISNSFQ